MGGGGGGGWGCFSSLRHPAVEDDDGSTVDTTVFPLIHTRGQQRSAVSPGSVDQRNNIPLKMCIYLCVIEHIYIYNQSLLYIYIYIYSSISV